MSDENDVLDAIEDEETSTPDTRVQGQVAVDDPVMLQRIIEGALLASGRAMSVQQLQELFDEIHRPELADIRDALKVIGEAYEGRGVELKEVASGFRFQVRQDLGPWVSRLWDEKPQRYSRALMETLALIAYRQPITRGDVEAVRGVAVSTNIIKTLLERDWVKVVGHKDVPGRPALYATTRNFLDYFNLKSLDELPPLAEIRDLDELSGKLDFGDAPVPAQVPASDADGHDEDIDDGYDDDDDDDDVNDDDMIDGDESTESGESPADDTREAD
ncbi:MAG: SMC-Scp complex subunit ScpB [Gammaproteobacteria bacterium]|nr:MAG: SMC-Scp complex subunit ScpB [Gammaproteobacteria bacterium]